MKYIYWACYIAIIVFMGRKIWYKATAGGLASKKIAESIAATNIQDFVLTDNSESKLYGIMYCGGTSLVCLKIDTNHDRLNAVKESISAKFHVPTYHLCIVKVKPSIPTISAETYFAVLPPES